MASSTAGTVAWKTGPRALLGSIARVAVAPAGFAAFGLAVENAMKMSPDPLAGVAPNRARPSAARRASRLAWFGRSGAAGAPTMVVEPGWSAGCRANDANGGVSGRFTA